MALPAIGAGDVTALLGPAAAIAFVGYTDVALTGRAFAAHTGETIDPNREFLAMGVANVGSGLTGGFALSASGSRTAIIDTMRARSQVAGLVAALSVVVVVLAVPGLIALIPKAALGGIVIFAGIHLIDVGGLRRLARFRTTELGLALAALVGVLVFGVLAGILIAVGLSVADLFLRVAGRRRRSSDGSPTSPGCTTSRTIPMRSRSPVCSSSATTRRCASPTPRTSSIAPSRPSTARRSPSSGSCSTRRPSSSST